MTLNKALQVHFVQHIPELSIRIVLERIQVAADGSREKDRVLGDDRKPRTKVFEANRLNIDAVQANLPAAAKTKSAQMRTKSKIHAVMWDIQRLGMISGKV